MLQGFHSPSFPRCIPPTFRSRFVWHPRATRNIWRLGFWLKAPATSDWNFGWFGFLGWPVVTSTLPGKRHIIASRHFPAPTNNRLNQASENKNCRMSQVLTHSQAISSRCFLNRDTSTSLVPLEQSCFCALESFAQPPSPSLQPQLSSRRQKTIVRTNIDSLHRGQWMDSVYVRLGSLQHGVP